MANSLISCEVDFETDGKQAGFLRVPHSVHRSAYGWIPVPIVSIRNGDGPVVLMMSGNHGDEYEGQIALSRLARDFLPEDLRGQVIFLTMANQPAAEAGLRCSPIDDGNLNRSFPGDPAGTPTQMIAHYIEDVLLPRCDYLIDLHSGGGSLFYPATLLRGQGWTDQEGQTLRGLQDAFDFPHAWVFQGGGGPNSTARTAMGAANRKRVVPIMAELGGAGSVTPSILAMTERGLQRSLHSLGMLPDYVPDAERGTRELYAAGSVFAYDSGLFEPLKDISAPVEQDETVGHIHDPSTPLRGSVAVKSPYAGIVMAKRPMAQVKRGDAVFQIGIDVQKK
ncbi:ectoine utilization protein EutE [Shimia thalassica]|uniref:Ectoine utilization protein EutE n=1 Tax=Shimia thalassica TaxID=1715693 RepID=A0A0P1ICD1_9RHOB|nr:succinylglutamate desuccinylase/aspartoacylase family protein [Shimia thalassica]CUJ82607.1 ectoine utilization protein EutE [Shimia thalassica]